MQWDSAVSLAFAAEQLFAAAQLLTSDLVPANQALELVHERHLVPLLDNGDFLPEPVRHQIVEAQHSYNTAVSKGLTRDFARCLASELMKILSEVTGILKQISGRSLLNLDRRVA